jgi:hypothetical protein
VGPRLDQHRRLIRDAVNREPVAGWQVEATGGEHDAELSPELGEHQRLGVTLDFAVAWRVGHASTVAEPPRLATAGAATDVQSQEPAARLTPWTRNCDQDLSASTASFA